MLIPAQFLSKKIVAKQPTTTRQHIARPIIGLGGLLCLLPVACLANPVYKAVLADGSVVYTDNANKAYEQTQNTQQIQVLDKLTSQTTPTSQPSFTSSSNAPNSVDAIAPVTPSANNGITVSDSQTPTEPTTTATTPKILPSQRGDYQLTIETPSSKRAYRRAVQPVEVKVNSNPLLKSGDRFIYSVNGHHIATTKDSQFAIPTDEFDPNLYTLTVNIENIKGDIVATANQEFYVLPNNIVLQQKRKAAIAAKEAYDKLPWYKKLKINISL